MQYADHEWPSSSHSTYNESPNVEIRDVLMTNCNATLILSGLSSGECGDPALAMILATNNRRDWRYSDDNYDSRPDLPVEEPGIVC